MSQTAERGTGLDEVLGAAQILHQIVQQSTLFSAKYDF